MLRGRWDRVDIRGGEVVIIDFKSTDVRAQADADRRAKDSDQLAIYTLAYKEVFGRLPARVELHFLGTQVVVGRARPRRNSIGPGGGSCTPPAGSERSSSLRPRI